tara:strand:- start:641 stop:919 length:279 start_codon:yes stop_codon:yes gene_type:complete
MKTELSKIAQDLERGMIGENKARNLLLGLLGVRVLLPSDDEIKERIAQQEDYHLKGMAENNDKVIPIEKAAMYCANSFDDAIRWVKDQSNKP